MFSWYNDKTKPNFWGAFSAVSLWIVFCALCLVFLHNCSRPHLCPTNLVDASIIKDVEQRKGVVDWSQLQVDSQNVIRLSSRIDSCAFFAIRDSVFRVEHRAGRLMTPDEMSEKITGYYDKLIDVLIALFAIFTFLSYIVVNRRFKQQYESDKEEIRKSLEITLKEYLKDSSDFRSRVVSSLKSEVDDVLASHDDITTLSSEITEHGEYIDLLISYIDEIREDIDSNAFIDDEQNDELEAAAAAEETE